MKKLFVLASLLISTPLTTAWSDTAVPAPKAKPAPVPCKTVADCWLDADGNAIPRPKRFKGRRLPKGNCGGNILWLTNLLSCEEHVCVSMPIGDRC
jgi:hypothetical protein